MKRLIGLIFTLLVCGLVIPHRVIGGRAECSANEAAYAVAAAGGGSTIHHTLAAAEDGSLTLQRLLDMVAFIVPSADMAAGKTSAKNDCFKNCKGCEGRPRGNLCRGTGGVAAYSSGGVAFSRAIDRYVYAFRHIII